MWYEALPSAVIMVVALSAPTAVAYGLAKLSWGHGYRRALDTAFQRRLYLRDTRIAGDPYTPRGLESIPD